MASITPIYSYAETGFSRELAKNNLDPSKGIKKFLKKLESFSEKTNIGELKDFLQSFKSYAEEQTGIRITSNDLYNLFQDKLIELNIPIDPSSYKFLFSKHNKHKGLIAKKGEGEQVYVNPQIVLGCVCIACSPLIAIIGTAVPIVAPYCYATAAGVANTGFGLILAGLCENDNYRKSLFIHNNEEIDLICRREDVKKIYISPNQVKITSFGIFVDLEDMPLQMSVDSLLHDDLGLYIMMNDPED